MATILLKKVSLFFDYFQRQNGSTNTSFYAPRREVRTSGGGAKTLQEGGAYLGCYHVSWYQCVRDARGVAAARAGWCLVHWIIFS